MHTDSHVGCSTSSEGRECLWMRASVRACVRAQGGTTESRTTFACVQRHMVTYTVLDILINSFLFSVFSRYLS